MNEDFFRYKTRFITFVLLLGYAYMHVKLTGLHADTTLELLTNFSARLPFGQRILIPLLVSGLKYVLPIELDKLYFLMEWLFISLLYYALFQLLRLEFNERQAKLLSWIFLLLLPLVTVVNYRFSIMGEATFFYPYDTPSLLFMTLGFLFCIRSQWYYLIPLIFIATINRESSFLLILMIPALFWNKLHLVYKPMLASLIVYIGARALVLYFLGDVPGTLLEWYYHSSEHTHFEVNLLWLLNEHYILLFIFCFAGLPLFWFAFYDYIPIQFRPLRYVALLYFLMLLLVGNFFEVRIFGEILIVLYFPVCVALKRWLNDLPPINPAVNAGIIYYADRYAVLIVLSVVVIFRQFLNLWVIWLSHWSS
jgi:hypothetical protein